MRFRDRVDAGRRLAERLAAGYEGRTDVLVFGLPRGGLPVAAQIARRIHAPLDVFLVRKVGVPGHAELAMGAIAEGGIQVRDEHLMHAVGVGPHEFERVAALEQQELERRSRQYRGPRALPSVEGRTVMLVDDGLATGSTMEAAIRALRTRQPARIVVAAPVGAPDTCRRLSTIADEVVCLYTPEPFSAVGLWYEDFSQTTDDQVRAWLDESRAEGGASNPIREAVERSGGSGPPWR
jgi:predicted phosphoribosyltransferase